MGPRLCPVERGHTVAIATFQIEHPPEGASPCSTAIAQEKVVSRNRKNDQPDQLGFFPLIAGLLLLFVGLVTAPVRGQEPVKPASRAEATAIIANARKIITPNGVERLE